MLRKYTKDHEWINLPANSSHGTIGISNYAAHALGDVVYVELPTAPLTVAAGDAVGAVESVKSASDINAPVSCTIVEANPVLEESPGIINKAPEEEGSTGGWVAKVVVGEGIEKELDLLMTEEEYRAFSEE
jgi:glycine cleavage system H protein